MKRVFWLLPALLLFAGCGEKGRENAPYEILLGGDMTALIIDANASDSTGPKVLWRWDVEDARDEIPAEYFDEFSNVDEGKFVDEGRKILITCGAGGVALLDRETKKVLFSAFAKYAHSADLLPGNRIAVALSIHEEGNSVEVYDIARSNVVVFRDTLFSGHGSVWLPERERYYALGGDELREYRLADWDSDEPKLERTRTWTLPDTGGHDLSAVSNSEFLISSHHGVNLFDVETEIFTPFAPLADAEHVKAVNYDPTTGQLVYTKAIGGEAWWTFDVVTKNPDRVIHIPEIKIYKARPHPVVPGAILE